MKKLISALLLSLSMFTATVVVAQPTVKEIYQTAQTDKQQALTMISEVIRLHPNSARAYFIQSELLLQSGKKAEARASFLKSQQLDPNFTYAKSESVARLRDALGIKPPKSTGMSIDIDRLILWGCGILLVILIAVMFFRRKKQDIPDYVGSYNLQNRPITPFNQTPGTSQPPQSAPSPTAPATGGSGIMGSLAQGAAMGAGVAAGATLVNHLLNGNRSSASPVDSSPQAPAYTPDNNFGMLDSGSDWDGGSSDSSSSSDSDSW